MQNEKHFMEPLLERIQDYGKTSYELVKLKTIDKSAGFLSELASRTVMIFIFSFFLIFASVGLACWLGEILEKIYFGFFIVAGFYVFLLGVLFLFFKRKIKKSFANSIISHLHN